MCDVCSPESGAGIVCGICADSDAGIDDEEYTGNEAESLGELAVEHWVTYG